MWPLAMVKLINPCAGELDEDAFDTETPMGINILDWLIARGESAFGNTIPSFRRVRVCTDFPCTMLSEGLLSSFVGNCELEANFKLPEVATSEPAWTVIEEPPAGTTDILGWTDILPEGTTDILGIIVTGDSTILGCVDGIMLETETEMLRASKMYVSNTQKNQN